MMGIFNILDPVFSFLVGPLLGQGYLVTLTVLAIVINIIIILVTKKTTNQNLMKQLKEEMTELREEMKALKDNPEKAAEVNQRFMETNMKMLRHSMRPNLYLFIPLLILVGWISANVSHLPIAPGDEFTVTLEPTANVSDVTLLAPESIAVLGNKTQNVKGGSAAWHAKALKEGKYMLQFTLDQEGSARKTLIITKGHEYITPEKLQQTGVVTVFNSIYSTSNEYLSSDEARYVKRISVGNKEVKPLGNLSIFGWHPGWLGTYIILSIILNIILRKLFKLQY